MKTVLVTGASGFLGQAVVRKFRSQQWRVLATGSGMAEASSLGASEYRAMRLPDEELGKWLSETAPDVCIHCAGSASVPQSMVDPAADFAGNVHLTFHLLDEIRHHVPACRFVFISSAAVYGEPESLPVREQQPLAPLSPYGYHKRQAEVLCEEYSRIFGIPTVIARVFSAYGPGLRRQVVWEICQQLFATGQVVLKGTGQETRDFVEARDVAEGLFLLAENAPANGEAYNLASGNQTSIADLVDMLMRATELPGKVTFDGQIRAGDPLHWEADISAIRQLGFSPQIGIQSGLTQAAQWARSIFPGNLP